MECPILPVGEALVAQVVAQGDFIRGLQQKLVEAGEDIGESGVDGQYGPDTAEALLHYQQTHFETAPDQVLAQFIPNAHYASCATYRRLGLGCDRVYFDATAWTPILGEAGALAVGAAIAEAVDQGLLSLDCPGAGGGGGEGGGVVAAIPSWVWWALGGAAAVAAGAVAWSVRRRREPNGG